MVTKTRRNNQRVPPSPGDAPEKSDVLVFVDDAVRCSPAIRHAQKVANAFGGGVVLVHVLCRDEAGDGPIDPVDWDIKKQKTLKWLDRLAQDADGSGRKGQVKLLEGPCIDQIVALMEDRRGDIGAVLRAKGDPGLALRQTALGLLQAPCAAILMIPEGAAIAAERSYRRLLVALDGSARAEAALPNATQLAQAEGAELILCYVAPPAGLTEFGIRDQEAEDLHLVVARKNQQAGRSYLTRIKNTLAHNGLKISTRIVPDGDVRRALIETVTNEEADLLVMATHGQSGHSDVPIGDVARFILDRSDIPVLMVRHHRGRVANQAFGNVSSTGVRQPTGTD